MIFGQVTTQFVFVLLVALAVGGAAVAMLFPMLSSNAGAKRVKAIAESTRMTNLSSGQKGRGGLSGGQKDNRRKQLQETLKQIEQRDKNEKRKRMTLRMRIMQSGLDMSIRSFWMFSLILGGIFLFVPFLLGIPWYVSILAGVVGGFGFPRWFLGFLCRRRQNIFLNDFADAIDVMVRGLKAGLPVTDAMKVIAAESGPPVGPEFTEVVEGQKVGISIDQGIERMFERMPLQEVNFLGIVMAIQAKTGGNLSEALSNLSKVLRDRKKMKAKIKAVSQEAKSSAAIIGALPFVIMGALTILNPAYLSPLFETSIGHVMVAVCATWMGIGVLVMKKMINFQI